MFYLNVLLTECSDHWSMFLNLTVWWCDVACVYHEGVWPVNVLGVGSVVGGRPVTEALSVPGGGLAHQLALQWQKFNIEYEPERIELIQIRM